MVFHDLSQNCATLSEDYKDYSSLQGLAPGERGGGLMIASHGGVPLYGLYVNPFWNFWRKSRTLFGIFVPNPNECNSTLTSGTNNIYSYPYIDVNDRGHRFRSGSPLTNYPHASSLTCCPHLPNPCVTVTFRHKQGRFPFDERNRRKLTANLIGISMTSFIFPIFTYWMNQFVVSTATFVWSWELIPTKILIQWYSDMVRFKSGLCGGLRND